MMIMQFYKSVYNQVDFSLCYSNRAATSTWYWVLCNCRVVVVRLLYFNASYITVISMTVDSTNYLNPTTT